MAKLKLKIGSYYRTRDGLETFKIVRYALPSDVVFRKTHPFVDEEGYAYMSDGRTHPTKDYVFDLVQEVIPKRGKTK